MELQRKEDLAMEKRAGKVDRARQELTRGEDRARHRTGENVRMDEEDRTGEEGRPSAARTDKEGGPGAAPRPGRTRQNGRGR